jgi:hypothetical protein
VLVRTGGGVPRYSVREHGATLTILLHGLRPARANDLRPLDTSFFPSVVKSIVPLRDAAGTRIDIHLRGATPHRVETDGDVLAIEFDAPGSRR